MLQPPGPKSLPGQERFCCGRSISTCRKFNASLSQKKKNAVAMTIKFSIQNSNWIYG